MKNFIIKSNEWFDKREALSLILIITITLFVIIITLALNWWWIFAAWVILYSAWRMSYIIIKSKNK